jgi:hypothetical protein
VWDVNHSSIGPDGKRQSLPTLKANLLVRCEVSANRHFLDGHCFDHRTTVLDRLVFSLTITGLACASQLCRSIAARLWRGWAASSLRLAGVIIAASHIPLISPTTKRLKSETTPSGCLLAFVITRTCVGRPLSDLSLAHKRRNTPCSVTAALTVPCATIMTRLP